MTVQILSGLTKNANQPQADALQILVLNLMPNRAVTERQFLKVFSGLEQNVDLTFCLPSSHRVVKDQSIIQAYPRFKQLSNRHFDGLIVTGAPLDQKPFAACDYWAELRQILTWRFSHVTGSLFVCWGAYAAGHIDGVFEGRPLQHKISGVYTAGGITMPNSRYFTIPEANVKIGRIIAGSEQLGATLIENPQTNSTYVAGHLEYLTGTLAAEYFRDVVKDQSTPLPAHYFDGDLHPQNKWAQDAKKVYGQWLTHLTTSKIREEEIHG